MKYLFSLLGGLFIGALLTVVFLIANPLAGGKALSPLEVADGELLTLNYSLVAEDAVLHTNNGEARVAPKPAKVMQLWEPAVRSTDVAIIPMESGGSETRAIGLRFASPSESTRILHGEAIVDSFWHVYIPGRGTFVVGQRENRFDYLREVVLPATWSSSKRWRGQWRGTVTDGPGPLGSANVVGSSGEFAQLRAEAIETVTARAYSAASGPVAEEGRLLIELPDARALSTDLADDAAGAESL